MSRRDDILEQLLTGQLTLDSDEVKRLFMEDPKAQQEFARLRDIEASFTEASEEELEVLAELEAHAGAPGEGAVAGMLESLAQESGTAPRPADQAPPAAPGPDAGQTPPVLPGPGRSPLRLLAPLAAAAAVLLVLWTTLGGDSGPGPMGPVDPTDPIDAGPSLGEGLTLVAPTAEVDILEEFRWEGELAPGEALRVFIYDTDPASLDPVAESPELQGLVWTPDPIDVAKWPNPLSWEAIKYRDRQAVSTEYGSVSRQAP